MKCTRLLLATMTVCCISGGTAMATPWFTDGFDYANQGEMEAAWSWEVGFTQPGELFSDSYPFFGPTPQWRMRKTPRIVRNYRSLVPAIQAVDQNMNAVNGTDENPLVVSFQMAVETASGRQEQTIMWLELVGQQFLGNEDTLFSAPTHRRGGYDVDPGVCTDTGSGKVCTAGYYRNLNQFCARDSDCDPPMWLDFISNLPSLICTVRDESLPLPRPSLAFGLYGGANGLIPKGVPGDHCSGLGTRGVSHSVVYDGDRWSRLTATYPPGSSATSILAAGPTTDVVLTIREADFDITVLQPVKCDWAGRCDRLATCVSALPGTCVDNICTGNGNACETDADCNFCSDDSSQSCTTDTDCRSMTCIGGANAGNACTLDADCVDYDAGLVCIGGSTDGATCTDAQGAISATCGRKSLTKAHIPRQYLGPFQTIAMGPGRVWEGFWSGTSPTVGSTYNGYIDNIAVSGGELLNMPTGSCCLADGSCVETLQGACVQLEGSVYNGDNTTCATARCAAGACCTSEGCVLDKTQAECEDAPPAGLGGIFQGIHSTCENRICCAIPFADVDWDGDVDQDDFGAFQICYSGLGAAPTGCECLDRDMDGRIDSLDFTWFSDCFTGPNVPWSQAVTPTCTP